MEEQEKQVEAREKEFVSLILNAYKADIAEGFKTFQGKKSGRLVAVGPVNVPVSRLFVEEVILECRQKHVTKVDILGFEFEMGLFPNVLDDARSKGIDISPKHIPAEVFDKRAIVTPFSFKTFTLPGEDELDYLDMKPRFQLPVQPVKFVSPDDKKKNTSNKHLIKKPVPKVTEEPLPPVVVQEKPIPVPPGPPPGIPPTPPIPVPPTGYPGIMPVYDTDELPMYPTPDPDAEWVGNTKRYIDWNHLS
jgi:hypothetical protein